MWWLRPTRQTTVPAVLLGLAAVVTIALTAEASISARRARDTAEGVLRDYAAFAASQFAHESDKRLEARLSADVKAVRHRAEDHERRGIGVTCEYCTQSESVRTSFALTGDGLRVLHGPPPADGAFAARLADDLVRDPGQPSRIVLLKSGDIAAVGPARIDGAAALVGAIAGPAWFRNVFEQVMNEASLLPKTLTGKAQAAIVTVRVTDADGRQLYESAAEQSTFVGRAEILPRFGGLVVRASIPRAAAASLIIGGLPADRWPVAVGLLVLASTLAVVAGVQLRREARFSRARANFVAGVSHELRTPLAQIRLFGETLVLGRMKSPDDQRRAASIIVTESMRLSQMVDKILSFARTGQHPGAGARELVDLTELVSEIVEGFQPLALSKAASIDLTAEESAIESFTDPAAVRQIVVNLLDNAVKYGPRGQTVRVSLTVDAERAVIAVDDEGPGVRKEDAEHVWKPFWRAAGASEGGAGLGLSNVRELVTTLGGKCRVENAPSGGARFVVELATSGPS